jgi:hypothetical protein
VASPKANFFALPESNRTVQMQWKLPARLRKPIREQLAKERQQKKQRQAIVKFERRPLHTQLVTPPAPRNQGAEHHTGDVYTASKPLSRVSLPPYTGSFSRKFTAKTIPKIQPVASVPIPLPPRAKKVLLSPPPSAAQVYPTVTQPAEEARVSVPKRRLSLPFHVSFWPKSLFSSKKKVQSNADSSDQRPSRLKNIGFLGVGFLLLMGLVWNLQGVGRGVAVRGSVEKQAQAAYEKLLAAQAAFAATDFSAGETQLKDAGELLSSARDDLRTALSSTQYVLKALDVTGTVTSSDEILAAGEELTDAGQAIARGAAAFFDVSLFGEDAKQVSKPNTLIDALEYAQQEFEPATESLKQAEKSLNKVGSPLLPAEVKEQVALLQKTVPRVREFLEGWQAHSQMILDLLGKDRERQYLLLFANNDELRPVGGFIGTVGLVNVDHGRVENIDITSVYDSSKNLLHHLILFYRL